MEMQLSSISSKNVLHDGTGEQKMADLPKSCVEPAPPFTYSAVDYFRPWYVKEGRKEVKGTEPCLHVWLVIPSTSK